MKRILTLIVAVLMVISSVAFVVGCTNNKGESTTASSVTETTETTTKDNVTTVASTTETTQTTQETTEVTTEETTEEPEPDYLRPVVDFNDFVFENVERSEFEAIQDKLTSAVDDSDFDKIVEGYDEFNEIYYRTITMSRLASLMYYKDTVKNAEYDGISTDLESLFNDMLSFFVKITYRILTETEFADRIRGEVVSEEDCDFVLENYDTYTDEFAEINSRIAALEAEYNDAINNTTIEVTVNGTKSQSTVDQIVMFYQAGKITSLTYYEYMEKAYKQIAKNVAVVYDKIIKAYKEKAEMLGYSSAIDMQYDRVFSRTYSPEKAQEYWAYVKEYIVPLYNALNNSFTSSEKNAVNTYSNKRGLLSKTEYYMVEYFKEVSPDMYNSWRYINKCNLLDIASGLKRYDASFTTYFYEYDVPYVFIKTNNGFSDVMTRVHELGHFFDYYVNGMDGSSDYDVAEIHSQGSEMLFFPYLKSIVDSSYNALLKDQVLSLLNAIIEGALHDEWQQIAFKADSVDYDTLYNTFKRLANEYGKDLTGYVIDGFDMWAVYSHHYQSPFYYISYGMSAISSLDIFVISLDDRQEAIDKYLGVIGATSEEGYLDVIERVGLHSPFEEDTYKYIIDSVKALFKLSY